MATRNYFDRITPKHSLGGFYTSSSSSSSSNNEGAYSLPTRRLRQQYLHDTKVFTGKVYSSTSSIHPLPSSSLPTTAASSSAQVRERNGSIPPSSSLPITAASSSEQVRERTGSIPPSSSRSQLPPSRHQSSLDLMASSSKCDDCHKNDGLFQCCHCNQRLCIRCCNKHYKKVTVELERLHELSDRLVAKIVHTKNDLERQKNETLEQCHKWRVDTINTINKAHTLIVQTIHDEYETLGKEYELFVQNGMAHINVDQNELIRMRKGNLGSLISSPSSSTTDSPNSIDTIRKRIETFAKNIDETGKFSFQVRLPIFDIDDRLRVESRFGDVTRSTSATWQNGGDIPSATPTVREEEEEEEEEELLHNVQPTETNVIIDTNDEIEEVSDKTDEQELDTESRTTTSSPLPPSSPTFETTTNHDNNSTSTPSSRYALSVENDIELQQQQFYQPTFRGDRYDSAYGTAPSSPNSSINNPNDHYSSTSSLHEQSSKNISYPSSNQSSYSNNRRHTHTFHRTSSPPPTFRNDNEDTYRSVQHVQLKREQDGTLEGLAVQIEQSHKTDGMIERRRTCMQACGVRRRTVMLPPRSPSSSSNTERLSNDEPWLYYRTTSSPSFTQ